MIDHRVDNRAGCTGRGSGEGSVTTYDVFLSYHWQDQAAVEPIARELRGRGLRVFLDRWYLVPGSPGSPS